MFDFKVTEPTCPEFELIVLEAYKAVLDRVTVQKRMFEPATYEMDNVQRQKLVEMWH
jgi:hypothetical protein